MDRVKPEDRAFYKNFNERSFNTSIPIYRSRVCTDVAIKTAKT